MCFTLEMAPDWIADIIPGRGYILYWRPTDKQFYGGLHIMDDFGELIQSLPQRLHDDNSLMMYHIQQYPWIDAQYAYH